VLVSTYNKALLRHYYKNQTDVRIIPAKDFSLRSLSSFLFTTSSRFKLLCDAVRSTGRYTICRQNVICYYMVHVKNYVKDENRGHLNPVQISLLPSITVVFPSVTAAFVRTTINAFKLTTRWKVLWESTTPAKAKFGGFCCQHLATLATPTIWSIKCKQSCICICICIHTYIHTYIRIHIHLSCHQQHQNTKGKKHLNRTVLKT